MENQLVKWQYLLIVVPENILSCNNISNWDKVKYMCDSYMLTGMDRINM